MSDKKRWEIPLSGPIVEELEKSFQDGPIINDQGQRFLAEHFVEQIGGLKIDIYSDEHPPPHFCVSYQNENASFSIVDCGRLPNNRGLEKFERNIKKWWKKNRALLVETWNRTRPTDCPVGPIRFEI